MTTAQALIDRLQLQPHPEGGWYAETWRSPAPHGERALCTAIHFLLQAGQTSHWHRVDATEIWLWHAGDPLQLAMSESEAGPATSVTLGADIAAGQQVQQVIPPLWWQAARLAQPAAGPAHAGYALVSCVVAPGFEFSGFELAPAGWSPAA